MSFILFSVQLVSILDLIASGSITKNFIEPTFELAETFTQYWNKILPVGTIGSMSLPFYHLETSGFWHLVTSNGTPHRRGRTISSVKRLRELYYGAQLDEELFSLLLNENSRQKLQSCLIHTYFSPENQNILAEMALVTCKAAEYSVLLLKAAEQAPVYVEGAGQDVKIKKKIRDQGFRKTIVRLYEHRCALCGIRIKTPEGHTVVEAAHIVPWSRSQDDKPQNGMALCRLCHWSFDKGLMGVGKEYEVLISPVVRQEQNFPGHMETLSGRGIFKPEESIYWPDQNNLQNHRQDIFRRA